MAGQMNVVVIGHDNKTKCAVANALYREKYRFKQFYCHKLNQATAKRFTFRGDNPRIITTPSLGTPVWAVQLKILKKEEEFRNKCFVYVKNMTNLRVNDVKAINEIEQKGKEQVVVVIPYLPHEKQKADDALMQFENKWKTILLNQEYSLEYMERFSIAVFVHISDLKPSSELGDNEKTITEQYVGGKNIAKADHTTQITDETEEAEMFDQISTVTVKGGLWSIYKVLPEIRPSTPHGDIELTSHHWETYTKVLSEGTTLSHHTRVNVVGYLSAGKTTLVRRLQEIHLETPESITPTECLEIDKTVSRCFESCNGELIWETHSDGYEKDLNFQRMAYSLNCTGNFKAKAQKEEQIQNSKTTNNTTSSCEAKIFDTMSDKSKYMSKNLNDPNTPSFRSDTNSATARSLRHTTNDDTTLVSDSISENPCATGIDFETHEQDVLKNEYLTRVVRKATRSPGLRKYISYWDFAGQAAYYTTHQAFMAPNSVYLLVVDLSKGLNEHVADSMQFRVHSHQNPSILDAVRFWAGSIKAFASDESNTIAPVIVVGTHTDKVTDNAKIDGLFDDVREIFGESDLACFAIDNTKSFDNDESLKNLRNIILDKTFGILEKKVPARWIDLEYRIILEKDKGEVVLTLAHLKEINKQLDVPLSRPEDLMKFLEHEHCNGFLMYFNTDGVKDTIILQPAILAEFINMLLIKKKEVSGWNLNGTFDQRFMENAARDNSNLDKYKNQLLNLLIHLKVVFPWEITASSASFFMPSLLGERPKLAAKYDDNHERSPLICISFKGKLIPPAFFHSLALSCMFAWKLDKVNTSHGKTNWQVFYHYIRFKLSPTGSMLLEMFWSECQIFVQFIHLSKPPNIKSFDCLLHLKTIEDKMLALLKTYKLESIKGVIGIECPTAGHNSFLKLKSLMKKKEVRCSWNGTLHMVTCTQALASWTKHEDSGQKEQEEETQDVLPEATRKRIITNEEVVKLSSMIGSEYQRLFVLLAFEISTIQQAIANSNNDVQQTIFRLFILWKKKMADKATVDNFLKVLPLLEIDEKIMWHVFRSGN